MPLAFKTTITLVPGFSPVEGEGVGRTAVSMAFGLFQSC
jgi:hypothetical protein